MPNESYGVLNFRTYTAGGALPVPGATIRVRGTDGVAKNFQTTLITDRDGVSGNIVLPTPNASLSLSPSAPETPYSLFEVEITAPGYFPKRISGLSVFPGVNSVQLINMIPETNDPIENLPRGNLDTDIPQNSLL